MQFKVENTLLKFIFLLVLALNGIIITDLFLSILQSPLTLLLIRVVIMLIILGFLLANGARHPEIKGQGWIFLVVGFTLMFLEPLTELLARVGSLSSFFSSLAPSTLTFLRTFVFYLFGYFCLAYGFFLWIPSIIRGRRLMEQTAAELELLVAERTRSLQEYNERLYRSKRKLQEANRLKNEFLASVSHELKTPLNSILGFCRLLLEEHQGPLSAKQKKDVEIIYSNSRNLLDQINKILDFARLESKKTEVELKAFPLADLIQEVASVIEPMIRGKPVELIVEADKKLPEVCTDRQKLGQLLLGILDNAVKFTSRGTIRISSGLGRGDETWWIRVSDTGEGIRSGDLPHIFEKFRQGDGSLSKRHGGTGLGLSIARKLATLLQGKIEVESIPGKGTAFTIGFPVQPQKRLSRTAVNGLDKAKRTRSQKT